jgi:two-component system response regulator FixJ
MESDAVVHVIDDDDAARDSLAFLLTTAGMQPHTYESPLPFLATLPLREPAVVVTDVRMPDMTGIELLRRLREIDQHCPVIVITGHADVPLAVEAMKLGAADFIEKPFDDDILLAAIRQALVRHSESEQSDAPRQAAAARIATLSTRERQVLDGLVAGYPNKTIAFDLGISRRTVEVYRANVMTKMQAASLSELVRMALLAEQAKG